jgi:hypothetical protein
VPVIDIDRSSGNKRENNISYVMIRGVNGGYVSAALT